MSIIAATCGTCGWQVLNSPRVAIGPTGKDGEVDVEGLAQEHHKSLGHVLVIANGGGEAEDEAGDHLPPARLTGSQVLGHDEAQPHPAQDHDEGAGGDGPDDHPRLAHQVVGVGQVGRGAGEDVAHAPDSLRQLSASSPDARSTTPQRVPWTPSITQPAKALAQRPGLRAERILSQMRPGSWKGTTA